MTGALIENEDDDEHENEFSTSEFTLYTYPGRGIPFVFEYRR